MVETQTDYAKLTTAFVHVFEGILHCSLLSQHSTLVSEGSYRCTCLAGGFEPTLTQLAVTEQKRQHCGHSDKKSLKHISHS